MRRTSIEAYNVIKESGVLSRLRWLVYDFVFNQGPCTASQVHAALAKNVADGSGAYTSRLSELRTMGVIVEIGETQCPFTGRTVILWDVTDSLPKRVTNVERLRNDLAKAKNRVYRLEAELVKCLEEQKA